jgi:hypothetical protein
MLKLIVWTVAFALLTVGLGINNIRADEPSGSNLTPVAVTAFVQPTAPAPEPSTRLVRQTPPPNIDPVERIKPTFSHPSKPKHFTLYCYPNGHDCRSNAHCCSQKCYQNQSQLPDGRWVLGRKTCYP